MGNARRIVLWLVSLSVAALLIGYFIVLPQLGAAGAPRDLNTVTGDAKRGAYLSAAAGCVACHTNLKSKGALLAGGPPLKTPFGTFYF